MVHSIRPGRPWRDTAGNPIQAHGGSIIVVDGTFYWYGENKERTVPGGDIWHWGIRCYRSDDLYNWEDCGLIIPPAPDDPNSPLHPVNSMVDRPHILYNRESGKYVCWLKCMHHDGTQTEAVLAAERLLGPYALVHTKLKPLGMSAGDFDLAVAPDGKAYYYFERVHTELICADLTDDYTNVTGYYSTHFPLARPPHVREAPAHFTRGDRHYLITSGTTGYAPNPSQVAAAPTFHGPWTVLGNPHPGDASRTSYNSQISSVFRHPHKRDLYIALADRWIADLPAQAGSAFADGTYQRRVADYMEAAFTPGAVPGPDPNQDILIDTAAARYVWLPLRFDGETPVIDWLDEWRIEDYA